VIDKPANDHHDPIVSAIDRPNIILLRGSSNAGRVSCISDETDREMMCKSYILKWCRGGRWLSVSRHSGGYI